MRHSMESGSPWEEKIGYARAVVDGEWIFVSGTTGLDYTNPPGTISENVVEQAEQAMQTITQALEKAGSSLSDVVRVRYILPDRADFEPCWPVLRKHFADVRPAATMICAGLMDVRMKIEIEVTARKRKTAVDSEPESHFHGFLRNTA